MMFEHFFEIFKDAMQIATGIVATLFSFYFSWQKIGKSVSAMYSININRLSEVRVNDIILSNNKNSPITVYSILADIDGDVFIEVEKFDSPIILKSLETLKISTTPVSYWDSELVKEKLMSLDKKITLYLVTNTSIIKCKTMKHKNIAYAMNEQFKNLKFIAKGIKIFNGMTYTLKHKYAFIYQENNLQRTVLVDKNGFMSDSIRGYNALPKDMLADKNMIIEWAKKLNIDLMIYDLENEAELKRANY